MMPMNRVALIGNSLPRRCGIATFTTDLQHAISTNCPGLQTRIVAMTDGGRTYDYPSPVCLEVNDARIEEYATAADHLNSGQFDAVSLQHEFGIFGGDAGGHIMALVSRLTVPLITTLHTVLAAPSPSQRNVLDRIASASSRLIVMAEKGRELLRTIYRVPAEKIEVIPHGIPDFPFVEPDMAKATLGFSARTVILTFGLLSPSKGIEIMIDAMPSVLKCRPDAVYVVLGATHPNLVRDQGETYRTGLALRAQELGIADHVVFLDRFVDQATLLQFISMCDIYVTPYLNESQMTSGTLAYSFGLGKAVVSTPYWHAQELLADGRGVLVPFGDAAETGREIAALLADDTRLQLIRRRAYSSSRSMIWARSAERYVAAFERARNGHRLRIIARDGRSGPSRDNQPVPEMRIGHFLAMCDDTGLFQHARHSIPDRSHGYCIDDNARALLLSCALNGPGERPLAELLTTRLAAFVQHAWNPDMKRFRNFMGYDRVWREDAGSEDSHGRALWALGECARRDVSQLRRRWAAELFAEALPIVEGFKSPRAWAFALLGLDSFCVTPSVDGLPERARRLLADRLIAMLSAVGTRDWEWFEDGLTYDNARLPQALLATGVSTATPAYVAAGMKSLRWLMTIQMTEAGRFRPIGTESFGAQRKFPKSFDQQPLEATATISACMAASRVDGDPEWKAHAMRVFGWFLGDNDLSLPLVDLETGSCCDGLHPDRPNENRGGESVVSYLLSLAEIRQLVRVSGGRAQFAPLQVLRV